MASKLLNPIDAIRTSAHSRMTDGRLIVAYRGKIKEKIDMEGTDS